MIVLISVHIGIGDESQQFKNHIRLIKWPEEKRTIDLYVGVNVLGKLLDRG